MGQRFEGKSLDEALTTAAQTFGVERYQLTYHVLLEKRGFLGGVKRIVIEAEVNEAAMTPPAAEAAPPRSAAAPAGAPRRERGGRGGGRGGGPRRERGGGRGDSRGPRRRAPRKEEDELQPGDFEQFAGDVPEQAPESDAAKIVRQWCERVISMAALSLVIRTEENETQIIVRLYGPDARRTTEQHGELLDAIQVLANKALSGRKVEKDIELDCEAFKGRRVEHLEQKAREVAELVRREGREQLLPAMTPIERRIVHLALADAVGVATESRGEGFYKRVAIIPKEVLSAE